ncbi:FGGY family carbohydrate kinase [Spiroplasma cantharicola]|uniref:Gluconate kinase n=1 Tax=Spiroplasma cantharicola TaxID=362837 RepID=A0A0M4JIN4_9MOLU|nr:FGGY family carbohydrate kinase [Spiroplasma cantharicola]ALD66503.1 gluconate kinase [Spiroplasma cantharicola]
MIKIFIDLGTTNIKIEAYDNKKIVDKISVLNKKIYFDEENNFSAEKLFNFLKEYLINLNIKFNKNLFVIFSSAMHTLIFLDENYNQIGKGHSLLEKIDFTLKNEEKNYFRKINKLVNSEFLPVYKIKNYKGINYDSITTLKSFILYKFTDENVIEISDAVGLGVINSRSKNYSKTILKNINVSESIFPKLLLERKVFNCSLNNFELQIDLGISDGASAAIGSVSEENNISLSLGTTLGIRYVSQKYVEISHDFDYCFPIYNNKWIYGISSSNGANNIELIAKKMRLTLDDLNEVDFSRAKLIDKQIFFYKERFDQNILNIEEVEFNIDLLYTYIIQMINRIKEYKKIIDSKKKSNSKIIATGGLFKNRQIIELFEKEFNSDIIISTVKNLSITGLKKISHSW